MTDYDWAEISEIVRNFGMIFAALMAIVALWFHFRRTKIDQERVEIDRRRLTNDTYIKAIEQLGSAEIGIRVGAVYALERIAFEEKRYHWPIMETLCAYVRERTPWPPIAGTESEVGASFDFAAVVKPIPKHRQTDIQSILTVIGRRNKEHRKLEEALDLSQVDLRGANLRAANFNGAYFIASNLSGACLTDAELRYTCMFEAHLVGANLNRAHLENTEFENAHLEAAFLLGTNLKDANLEGTFLKGARFHEHPKKLGAVWNDSSPPHDLDQIIIDPGA